MTSLLWMLSSVVLAGASLLPLDTERLRASVGGYAVMNCHLDFPFGNEIPYHLQWDKDGEMIFSWYSIDGEASARVADRWGGRVRRVGDGRLGLGRGSINVSAVRETDAGLYRCRVAFPNRTPPERNNGTFYYLDVDGGNLIVTPPMNMTVLEGERAEFECQPKLPESIVEWYKDGMLLEQMPELASRCELAINGSLVLRRAISTDAGEFQCRVNAPDEQQQSASAYLDVQYKAKVVYSPSERFLALGKPASLDCHFSANPPLTNLRWEKDGFLFDPYNVPGVFYSRNGSLLFNKVDESHEGLYSCTPYNALGSEGGSGAVRVHVLRPPSLAARPQPLYVARRGDRVTMPCSVAVDQRHDQPTVVWTRNDGNPLPEGRYSVDGGNLTINSVDETDRGVYVCAVSNAAASVAMETELMVENVPPRAPHNLTAHPHDTSIQLSWVPGHNGPEVEYTVWYRERHAHEWRTMKILSRGVTEATLVGLQPGKQHELRVLASDQLGDGLFSKPIFVWTTEQEHPEESATIFPLASEAPDMPVEAGAAASAPPGGELEVNVRLIDEGALIRWSGAEAGVAGGCSVRWYEGSAPGERLLQSVQAQHDYLLVNSVEEGVLYWARVDCGGTRGGASLRVPEFSRMRGVAGGCAAAALILAAAAAAIYFFRHRLFPRRAPPPLPSKRVR
ncbi:protein borderless isoform X1 [Amyelois transitella]|uniref:protein borderless isoform X1 n=2 Tax=Amyelois transitella TaxID=680683 RepID=UPI0029902EDA|nr:protein borderless isoform X1 [Amyelois transitella]